jgi:hypothetical protein
MVVNALLEPEQLYTAEPTRIVMAAVGTPCSTANIQAIPDNLEVAFVGCPPSKKGLAQSLRQPS